jgi:outer membrane lipoprotein-sorting protein
MLRSKRLVLASLPLAAVLALPQAAAVAQASSPLAQVQSHLRAVDTMSANFSQTDRRGRTLAGTVYLKRPGKIRFMYQKGVPITIVGDGNSLVFHDSSVNQTQRWPIRNSPLSVLLDPSKDLSRVGKVVRNDAQTLLVQAKDPKRPEFGTITVGFAKIASAPGGLLLQGWTTLDAQNNRTTVKLSGHRFNTALAESLFRFTPPPKKGPRG